MVLVRYEELVVRIAHDGSAYAGARACRAHRVEAEAGGRDADETPQHDDDLKLAGRGGRHGTILLSTRSQCDASAVRRITEGFYLQTYLIPRHRRGSIHSSRRVLICVATNVSSACGPCVAAALAALMSAPPSARLSVSTSLAPRRGVGVGAGVVAGVDASTGGIWSLVESSPLAPGGRS